MNSKEQATNHKIWEYCQIDVQVQDDGRDPTRAGHRMMWFQFQARVSNPTKNYIAKKSTRVPMANMLGAAAYAPQKNNPGHENILNLLLHSLEQDGWELLPEISGEWWQRRLRRAVSPSQRLSFPYKEWFVAGLALILGTVLFWQVFTYYWTTPFPAGVRQFTELNLIDDAGPPYRTGKLLIINLTNGHIDPLQEQLPANLQATTKDEIGTLVWLDCHIDGHFRWTESDCELTVIDFDQLKKLDVVYFEGNLRGDPVNRAGEFHDEALEIRLRDTPSILSYILNLPAQ